MEFGRYNQLAVTRTTAYGIMLTDGDSEVLLPNKYVPDGIRPGASITIFLYFDSEDRPVATTQTPLAVVGDIKPMTVKAQTPVGAFLDWGLDKDLLVPFGEQRRRMAVGERHVVRVYCDRHTGRILASSRLGAIMNKSLAGLRVNQEVDLLIYDRTELGYLALVNRQYSGLLYHDELYQTIQIGDELKGYIRKLREDGKLDLRLQPSGFGGVLAVKDRILEGLRNAGGFLPLNSQSSPDDVERCFQMSKKTFKQAIGNLYKERRITIADDGIRLVEPPPDRSSGL